MNCAPSASQLGGTEHSKLCRRCGETLPVSSFPKNRHGNCRPCCHKCAHIERVERRASRPAWRNAHIDRLEREREARRIRKEYREALANAPQAADPHKPCNQCGETKPAEAFERLPTGNRRITCRDCRAERRSVRRHEAQAPIRLERQQAEEAKRAAEQEAEQARRRKREERKLGIRKRPLTAEQQGEAMERVGYLSSLLLGTHPDERISDQQTWEATSTELRRLWLQSGDKVCVSCMKVVPPTAIRPPGPANFYPGKCNSCATADSQQRQLEVYGRITMEPRRIPLRDGTSITVAELGRRVLDRTQALGRG